MKCCIRWIDDNGKATPDDNDAVMLAQFHTMTTRQIASSAKLDVEYLPTIERELPICAEHLARVTSAMHYGNGGGWSFVPLEPRQ